MEYKYTLDSYEQQRSQDSESSSVVTPATIPILPFPFSDVLLQGQRKQLNLYEKRFHDLFDDAMENHCGMVGMGLLTGNGMITTVPLCEVESYTKFGADVNWVDRGDGMGNGSIIVTIRAVGRAKIVAESDGLMQEEPYMQARVMELLDDDASVEGGVTGLRERANPAVSGESSPLSVASSVATNIESMVVSLASMELKLKLMEERTKKEGYDTTNADMGTGNGGKDDDDEVMNRRLVNAQLESLFMKESTEGVDMESAADGESKNIDEEDEEEDDDDDEMMEDYAEEKLDRVAQFQKAFESAKEADTFGYVLQPATTATDDLSRKGPEEGPSSARTAKDLVAISWAAFCVGENDSIQREVLKIQALDITNVLQRLQLAAAMLREDKKKWKAKLALAGIKDQEES